MSQKSSARASSLRILFVAPYVPSPIRVRPYQFVRALARAGHRVTVAAFADEFGTEAALSELRDICEAVHIVPLAKTGGALRCLLALPTPTPLWAAYCRVPAMTRLLQRLSATGEFDVAHVEHLRAAHFAPALGALPKVFDAVDCITALRRQMLDQQSSRGLSRLLSWEEWSKLRGYEPRAYRPFSRIVVTSQHDADALTALSGGGDFPPLHVIPNGVDLDYFRPDPAVNPQPDSLVFSGKMSYHANDDAARFLIRDVLPPLRERRPHVRAAIVGSSPAPSLRALAAASAAPVDVTGFVDDLRPHLSHALLAACPMRIGVGIQNKALEAMAMGRVAVCSPLAARPLGGAVKTGGVQIAESADAFAETCARLLSRPDETLALGEAARRYVETEHRWSRAAEGLVSLYEEARRESGSVRRVPSA